MIVFSFISLINFILVIYSQQTFHHQNLNIHLYLQEFIDFILATTQIIFKVYFFRNQKIRQKSI